MHEKLIKQSFALAKQAVLDGDHPFGALLVHNDEVILTAQNTVNSDGDFTKHAEMNLLHKAAKKYSRSQLSNFILYTSTEPCMMCSGAIYWSGIHKVVYGCSAQALQDVTKDAFLVSCRDLLPSTFEIVGPICEHLGKEIHKNFWK
ncbi:nucleoside deaminase [Candidatus Uabimicrobium amorphum]|uniref:tRNA-specific adenosine deaminase n=1 Tax=Uabimicrobium amorphum TaxID=2596890 RepID=A0A5S9IQJ7_UABAM|nr:nucleoside deaminase [Candidatus Uabimicrobium amorphum]BBM85816.1 tRNA-specific adenosine deaminase [Candidatus Uabimicrobium amorphum]